MWAETSDSALFSSLALTGETDFFSVRNGVVTAFPAKSEYQLSLFLSHDRSTEQFF